MSQTIIVTTYTGSTYTLRRATGVPGQPATIQHRRDVFTPPEALIARGAAVNVAEFEFSRDTDLGPEHLALVARGSDPHLPLRTSAVQSIVIDGVHVPIRPSVKVLP